MSTSCSVVPSTKSMIKKAESIGLSVLKEYAWICGTAIFVRAATHLSVLIDIFIDNNHIAPTSCSNFSSTDARHGTIGMRMTHRSPESEKAT